jgi:multisubunit Na+/H+ antiporter MnhC subunit
LIGVKAGHGCARFSPLRNGSRERTVPAVTAIVVTAITVAFVVFAGALAFVDQWSKKK